MTPYGKNFGPESVEELKVNINSTHEDFLREDDPEKKSDALRYMSAYAMQFLYLVPHDKKFIFKQTERVLYQSAMNISDFDPREASIAFEYLARYAHNMLDQPWRRDFRTIKLTSGFYVHNISSQLKNAHEILVALGYVHVNEVTLNVVPNLSERRLKDVSRDMIVASQECLILSQMWQRVQDQEPNYPLTISEIFEFRLKYLGDTDTICKTMISDIRRRNYEAQMGEVLDQKEQRNFVPVDKLVEFEGMELGGEEVDFAHLRHIQEPEVEEHIYDPVYSGNNFNGNSTNYPSYSTYPHSNSAFVSTRHRDSVYSPMIPKTVTSLFTNQTTSNNYYNPLSSSSSLSSGKNSRHSYAGSNLPLKFSKIFPQDDWTEPYGYGESGYNRRCYSDRKSGEYFPNENDTSHTRKPIVNRPMAGHGEVFPDNYFPRVVKPTPIHSSQKSNSNSHFVYNNNLIKYRGEENNSDEEMDEVSAYHEEINGGGAGPNKKYLNSNGNTTTTTNGDMSQSQSDYSSRSQATSAMVKSGWETDTRSINSISSGMSMSRYSDNEDPTPSSPEASSWDGEATIQRSKGSNHKHQDQCENINGSNSKKPESPSEPNRPTNLVTKPQPSSPYQNAPIDVDIGADAELQSLEYSQSPQNLVNLKTESKSNSEDKKKVQKEEAPVAKMVPWDCRFCTFKNKKAERICEVCAKSKDFFEEEDEETVLPPPQAPAVPKLYSQPNPEVGLGAKSEEIDMIPCPMCTLLNRRISHVCEACGQRLRIVDSPKLTL